MKKLFILVLLGALVAPNFAYAQTQAQIGFTNGNNSRGDPNFVLASPSNPLPVAATASIAGFIANGGYTTLTSTASSSASTTIPAAASGQAATSSVRLTNNGTSEVSCVFSTTTATGLINKTQIPANSSIVRGIGAGPYITIACINQAGDGASNVVVLESGTGLGNDSGGGGSGSGSGGAVTLASGAVSSGAYAVGSIVNGADVVLGNNTDTASCASGTSLIACQRQTDADIKGSIPIGSNIIGKVGIDQTTPGTTNLVALAAGTNVIGGIFGSPNITPTSCKITLTTANNAQNAITAGTGLHGVIFMNTDSKATGIWASFVTTALAGDGDSFYIPPYSVSNGAGSFAAPLGFGFNTNLSIVASDNSHVVSCVKY